MNKSFASIVFGDVINLTANATDELELSFGQIIVNASPAGSSLTRIFNFSLNREIRTEFSQNITVDCDGLCVINFTVRVNDTAGNFRTNDTIITVLDNIAPVVNTSLNKSLTNIFQNDIINFSANVTDSAGLSFCQIIINQSGPSALEYINVSLNGATSAQCYNVTEITLATNSVINFTIRVNDTSNNFRTNDTIVTVVSAATAPIVRLINATGFSVDPVSGTGAVVLITFNISDEQGVSNINASKSIVNLTLGTPGPSQFRYNISDKGTELETCGNHTETAGSTGYVIVNCTIRMRYFDNVSSNWVINVSVTDLDGLVGRNGTQIFTYNSLSSISLPHLFINFSSVFLGAANQPAFPHLVLNNTGNDDFDMINMTGADLVG